LSIGLAVIQGAQAAVIMGLIRIRVCNDPPTPLAPIFLADDFGGIGVHVFDLLGWSEK
jgi:hypothetical protein